MFKTIYGFTIVLFLHLLAHCLYADHIPTAPDGYVREYESDVRLFLKKDKFNFLTETKGRFEGEESEFRYHSVTAGLYYRLHSNIKVGGFYRLQRGVWHDDDWIVENGRWHWRDTKTRNEHLLIADITPRMLLSFLPGRNWVAEVKTRYYYNTFNEDQTVTIMPGLTYFWMDGLDPFINISLQYEAYLPLNYGQKYLYEEWFYLGVLYHVSANFKAGIFGAVKKITWGTSAEFKEKYGDDYQVTYRAYIIGLNAIFYFSL